MPAGGTTPGHRLRPRRLYAALLPGVDIIPVFTTEPNTHKHPPVSIGEPP